MPRGVYRRSPRPPTQQRVVSEDSSPDLLESGEGGDLKVHIYPFFRGPDEGDGGIRRVVEAQEKYLPQFGIKVVEDPAEADVIACHIQISPAYLARFPNKPIVAHCHGLYWEGYDWQKWALEANQKVMELLRLADAITAPSEWVANAIRRATSRPVNVVNHGINCEEWQPQENLGYVLWNKTRPDPICDPEPMNQVAELLPEIEFISTYGEEAPNVTLTGRLPYERAKALICKAGVYLCTAKETFGIGTLEAMAAGVPVVGFAWGGQLDIVRHALDGFLVRPGAIESLAQAIRGALHDREQLSENAQQRAFEFTWAKAAESYAAIYKTAAATYHAARSRPKTTVVVTNYNLHKYLGDCLKSVQDQSDKDWECIVVDDASTASFGREIVKKFADGDKRFKLIENVENVYLAEARNIGIRQAQGKYILPLDADDMLAPDTVKLLSDALDVDRRIHVAYGKVMFVDEDGVTPTIYAGYEHTPGYSGWPLRFQFEYQIRQRNMLPYASMFRRTAWEYTGGYRPRCRTAEDADFWTRLSSYGFTPKFVVDAPTLIYRNREGSMSREQGPVDWIKWFPWARDVDITPAGASTEEQLPVQALDRIVTTVVIPVGPDHRVLVKDAIDSIDAQFFRGWECIVVNDSGSPLDELPAWVKIINTAGARGVAAARNQGIRAAKAPLFLPLDADDYLQPNALKWMLEAHATTRDIIYADFWEDPDTPGKFKVYECKDYDACRLTHGTIHCVTALTPVEVWERVGGYDESLPAWEDWDFQIKAADMGFCSRRLAVPAWVYRKHTGQRRNDNVKNFEVSKKGILSKWSELWEGSKELAGCRSCSGKATMYPQSIPRTSAPQPPGDGEEVVLVQYTGAKQGNIAFKGGSGTFYIFAAGDQPRYVLERDSAMFLGRSDFKLMARPPQEVVENAVAPVLVAEGKPS